MNSFVKRTASLLIASSLCVLASAQGFQKGLCVEGTRPLESCHVEDIKGFGVSHVSLNPFGWMSGPNDPGLRFSTERGNDTNRRFWGESNDGLIAYSQKAHEGGLEVMLRPHIWMRSSKSEDGRDLWLQDIDFPNEADAKIFGENYRAFALHYAKIAEEGNMEWYSIGAETTKLSTQYPDYWRDLIKEVRTVYSGKLLYSGNWYQEVQNITFWDDLDAIGVQAYFPLTDNQSPTKEELINGWRPHLDQLERLSKKFNKPVIFTEIGYKSTTDTASTPWEWKSDSQTSEELQQLCYEAAFEALKGKNFIQGMYWWKYHVLPCENLETASERYERDFTFQNKKAESALRSYYTNQSASVNLGEETKLSR